MRLNQFSVTQKLWSLVGCLLAGLLLVTAGSLYYLNGVSAGIACRCSRRSRWQAWPASGGT